MNSLNLWASFCVTCLILTCQVSPVSAERNGLIAQLKQKLPTKLGVRTSIEKSQISNPEESSFLSVLSGKIEWGDIKPEIDPDITASYQADITARSSILRQDLKETYDQDRVMHSPLLSHVDDFIVDIRNDFRQVDLEGLVDNVIMSMNASHFDSDYALNMIGMYLTELLSPDTPSGKMNADIKRLLLGGFIQRGHSQSINKNTRKHDERKKTWVDAMYSLETLIQKRIEARYGSLPSFEDIKSQIEDRVKDSFKTEYCLRQEPEVQASCVAFQELLKNTTRDLFLQYCTDSQNTDDDLALWIADEAAVYTKQMFEAMEKFAQNNSNETANSSVFLQADALRGNDDEHDLLAPNGFTPIIPNIPGNKKFDDVGNDDIFPLIQRITDRLVAEYFETGVTLKQVHQAVNFYSHTCMMEEVSDQLRQLASGTAARVAMKHAGKKHAGKHGEDSGSF